MRRTGSFSLVLAAGLLALAACNSPVDAEPEEEGEEEVEETGFYHVEFNRTQVAGEEVVGTMWVKLRRDDAIWVAEMYLEDPERLGSIRGSVRPGPGVDLNWKFHFDPDFTAIFPGFYPADDCLIAGIPSFAELEERILEGRRSGLCFNRIRVVDFILARDLPDYQDPLELP